MRYAAVNDGDPSVDSFVSRHILIDTSNHGLESGMLFLKAPTAEQTPEV